ncbi:hypothetical protein TSAR_007757 [Trichomalopsis sarcophagae]|uniref:Uncharacterized protein n=1 Tax=Trichomalopsis sarcophagae TaxID=543379 RepID=A0A232F649_9HYME|nr:hypothetical protein TSAR_007757 [Trichomalopsis sarcophagae]
MHIDERAVGARQNLHQDTTSDDKIKMMINDNASLTEQEPADTSDDTSKVDESSAESKDDAFVDIYRCFAFSSNQISILPQIMSLYRRSRFYESLIDRSARQKENEASFEDIYDGSCFLVAQVFLLICLVAPGVTEVLILISSPQPRGAVALQAFFRKPGPVFSNRDAACCLLRHRSAFSCFILISSVTSLAQQCVASAVSSVAVA